MVNDPRPIESGSEGVIVHIGGGVVNVNWDNGRSLGLVIGEDKFIIKPADVTETEIIKERNSLIDALRRIESVYDWQDDLAGKIAHEALKDVKH
jgi:hypothetical protein